MRLCIARHGHKANQLPDYDGGFNTPLSDVGHRQADELAAYLSEEEEIEYLYSSPQLRSLQTAEPLHDRLDETWHVWPVFAEGTTRRWPDQYDRDPEEAEWATAWRAGEAIDPPNPDEREEMHGHYYLLSEIPELFPGTELTQPFPFPDAWWTVKRGYSAPMGYARADLGLSALLDRHEEGDRIAIVCHGTIGDMLVTTLKDFSRRRRHFACNNAGVHRLDQRSDDTWRIAYTNNTRHLTGDLRV